MDDTDGELPNLPFDVLRTAGDLIGHVAPELIRALGNIAASGATAESQNLLNALADVSEKIQRAVDQIFEAINCTPVYIPPLAKEFAGEATDESVQPTTAELADTDPALEGNETTRATEPGSFVSEVLKQNSDPEPDIESEPKVLDGILREVLWVLIEREEPMSMENLRKAVPALSVMTDYQYNEFRKMFRATGKEQIAAYLAQEGKYLFGEEGRTRGKKYRVEGLAGEASPEPSPEGTSPDRAEQSLSALYPPEPINPTESKAGGTSVDRQELAEIPELHLSAFETEVVRCVEQFLSGFDGRQSIRTIVSAVFGRTYLPKDQEGRLIQILDAYTEAGQFRSYGRTYGYKTGAELAATMGMSVEPWTNGEEVGEADHAMLQFIVSNAQNREINIGEIIRCHIGVEVLERPLHHQLIERLNQLADRGYLVHAAGSPWYGVGPKLQSELRPGTKSTRWQDRVFPSLTPVPLAFLPEDSVDLRTDILGLGEDDLVAEDLKDGPSDTKPIIGPALEEVAETEEEPVILDEVMADVLQTLMSGQPYRMEELRKTVPALASMNPEQYKDFQFKFRYWGIEQIQAFLDQNDKGLRLKSEGRGRGKTYWIHGLRPLTPNHRKTHKVTDPAAANASLATKLRQIGGAEIVEAPSRMPLPVFQTDDTGAETMKLDPILTRRVVGSLRAEEDKRGETGMKLPRAVRKVQYTTGWSKTVATRAVACLIQQGTLVIPAERPHEKGTKVLTARPVLPFDGERDTKQGLEHSNNPPEETDNPKIWTGQDTNFAVMIIDSLIELKHVQQGKSVKDLIKDLGITEGEQETEFRRVIHKMKQRGLVIAETANPNTRSDHSKRIYVQHIKLPDQKFKRQWKNTRAAVIEKIRSFEGSE